MELSATFEANNTWPDPDDDPDDPPRHLAKQGSAPDELGEGPKADHNGTYIFLGDVFFPILIEPHAMLQPFIGVGGAMVAKGDADTEANVFAIDQRGAVVFTYGIGISFKLGDSFMVGAKFRDTLFLTKKLTYLDEQGRAFEQRIGTVSTSSIQVGLSVRLTRKK